MIKIFVIYFSAVALVGLIIFLSILFRPEPDPIPVKTWIVEYSFLLKVKKIEVESWKKPHIFTKAFGIGMQSVRYCRNPGGHESTELIRIPITHTILIYEKGHRPKVE